MRQVILPLVQLTFAICAIALCWTLIEQSLGTWGHKFKFPEVMRTQFNLPENMRIQHLKASGISQSFCSIHSISGLVEFSEEEFKNYAATLNDPSVWHAKAMPYASPNLEHYHFTSGAIRWEYFQVSPLERIIGTQTLKMGFYSEKEVRALTHGQYICYGIDEMPRDYLKLETDSALPKYVVANCNEFSPPTTHKEFYTTETSSPDGLVFGVLNEKTRRLHMFIQFLRPHPDCLPK